MLSGNLPSSLGYFEGLKRLHLSVNSFSGPIPENIGNLSHLEELELSYYKMSGTILESIGQLTELTQLNLFGEGIISEIQFLNLTKLSSLSLSSTTNLLVLNVSHDLIPSFDLFLVEADGCQLGPAFPAWLRTQKNLWDITLKNAAILDTIPDWLWNLSTQISNLDLSHNQLSGNLPGSLKFTLFAPIDLSINLLEGSLPLWTSVTSLYLRNNSFSGEIPIKIYQEMPQLFILDLSMNFLNGSIPSSINKLKNLVFIDLSNNHLSGEIHDHWKGMQNLYSVDLSKNNLSGGIPNSMCSLPILKWLQLSNNNPFGDLCSSLKNCSHKFAIDLGDNRFSGIIPKWIGERFFSIVALRLRGNLLSGNIPEELFNCNQIHVLDLGHNSLSGSIPTCFGSLGGYQYLYHTIILLFDAHSNLEHTDLVSKGRHLDYGYPINNTIDLSQNNLSGEIPIELTNLSKLDTLNLSLNHLTGKIPEIIRDLQYLETLDLSCNLLSGSIPQSMTLITALSSLNLSYSDLSGQIPTASQFQTFNDPSNYVGNTQLCGPPLPTNCSTPSDKGPEHKDQENLDGNTKGFEELWLYVSVALGFIVGFWAVCGTLVVKKSWRHAYFHFVDEMKDRLFVVISVNVTRLRRKIKS